MPDGKLQAKLNTSNTVGDLRRYIRYGTRHPIIKITLNIIVDYKCLSLNYFYLTLGVSICLDVVSIETLDLDAKKGQSRRSRKSRFSLDELSQDRNFWLRSRFFETCRDFCDFSGFLDIFLNQEITWFLIYLDWDIYFSYRNLWWVRM